ncbi:hypothetical protein EZV62_006829 [Acer yangbiense]|uniref:NB-ARC domain-containing protein n=1 Tax=Acer yangbiense TaxID=1000413 RepID=A0A5C7I8T0_9ROSI|nr:hypothetical protein EZV62_006829 [Acer yangbiense]
MVDAVVSFALNRLTDFLIDEAVFLGSVRQEVQWLKNELEWMQCYIASAEEKQDDNPIVRKWLSDITEIAYDAEDVIDKFILQVHDEETKERKQLDDQDTNKETKPTGCFPSMFCCINCRKKGEGNSSNALATLRQLRRTTSFSIEKKVVGHDDGTTRLLAKLLNQDRRRFVVSIYGMGGLGKTTLAGKLYHHLDVKGKFDCRAWVCVSQDYNTHDLLLRIIISFGFTTKKTEELQQMNEEGLERYLHESLQGRSYLLVADDIWKKEAWLSIKRAFPDCNNGSRVIITTRSQEVAEDSDKRTYVHKLRFLTFDESWQLFCEKAFANPNANGVEEQLNTLGMEMVQKCESLPLALIVLGGHLSNKTQLAKWKAREALYSPKENCLWLQQSNPSLRSLLSFDRYGFRWDIMKKITDMYTEFRFLRVLNLDGYHLGYRTLSERIGKLIHLMYLGLRETGVQHLPQSIINLRRLQTLDLFSKNSAFELPYEISMLQELRHLFGNFNGNLKIDSLTKLQSLNYVYCLSWISMNTEKLGNLRELWIYGPVGTTKVFCFDSIAKLERLEQLVVKLSINDCFAPLQPLTHCSNLVDLRLYGKIEKLPEDIHNVLPNLECLC